MNKQFLSFTLGALSVISVGAVSIHHDGIQFPDGSFQSSADTRRSFYLTTTTFSGATADIGCEDGFHMASLWQILDVSNLRYDQTRGLVKSDSGSGPPTGGETAGPDFAVGWVRTGFKADVTLVEGHANCDAWSSDNAAYGGTTALLNENWDGSGFQPAVPWLGPWETGVTACNESTLIRVWCVQD